MGTFSKWTNIRGLVRASEILSLAYVREIVATEKIHGTSVRFGVVNGVFRVGGRHEEFDFIASKARAGFGFLGWLRERPELIQKVKDLAMELGQDVVIYGEWYGEGIQKGIKYLQAGRDFRLFGMQLGECLQDYDVVMRLGEQIGVRTAPVLYRGVPDREVFDQLRLAPSVVAQENGVNLKNNLVEGVVISAIPMQRIGRNWPIAKYKNPRFAERSSEQESKQPKVPKGTIEDAVLAEQFVEEFWTLPRLVHILTYFGEKDSNFDLQSPSLEIVSPAIKSMFEDVMKEGEPEWRALPREAQRLVGKLHPARTRELLETYWRELTCE